MTIQKTLELDFMSELNRLYRMRVHNAKDDITSQEISSTMDEIITRNIFSGSGGELTGKVGARMVIRETSDFDLI